MRCVSLRYESETVVFTHCTVECNNKQGGEHVACIEDGVFANNCTLAYRYFSLCLHAKCKRKDLCNKIHQRYAIYANRELEMAVLRIEENGRILQKMKIERWT